MATGLMNRKDVIGNIKSQLLSTLLTGYFAWALRLGIRRGQGVLPMSTAQIGLMRFGRALAPVR